MRAVAVEDGGPFGVHAEEQFRLGVGDRLDRQEELDMHRLDGGDDADMRARERGQGGDLAGVVHADFLHHPVDVAGHPGEAEGQAPVVVQAGPAGDRAAVGFQGEAQQLLGPGLADAARHRDDAGPRAVAAGPAEPGQRRQRVVDPEAGSPATPSGT
jgi:hypothetical protein